MFFAWTAALYPICDDPIPETQQTNPLDIYGLSKLAGEHLMNKFHLQTSISKVVICPLLPGSGTHIKLQEAMNYGIPIVTTRCAASGFNLNDGVNAFITDEPELYAQRALNLVKEPKLAPKISEEGAMTFEREYSRSAVYSNLDAMLGI